VQAEFSDWKAGAYLGIPIDPSAGSTNTATLLAGVPFTRAVYADDIYRTDKRSTYRAVFTSDLTDELSVRVAARQTYFEMDNQGLNFAAPIPGGARDPRTGLYTPGLVYGPGPTFTASPAPAQSRIFNRGGQRSTVTAKAQNFQNDWVYRAKLGDVQSVTNAGFAYTRRQPDGAQFVINENLTHTPLNFDGVVISPLTNTGVINTRDFSSDLTRQFYVNESVTALDGRLIVSGGVSRLAVSNSTVRLLATVNNTTSINNEKNTVNYGVVVKPVKDVSLFYGHSENASAVATNLTPVGTPDFSVGDQDEFGARVRLLENRLQVGVTYYKIAQNAFSIPNPANLTVPAPIPPAPLLYSDREAKGWEIEATFEVVKGLTLIGNYTDFTNRDPNNIPFRGTAEKSSAVWARYEFIKGELKGFSASLGTNWTDKRPGDSAGGFTAASTPTNLIPNQPTFYLPARTLVDASFGYTRADWSLQANVDNVFDKKYLSASLSRNAVYAGTGINLRVSATYRF
jgi:iron complex outermembrane receptor protein